MSGGPGLIKVLGTTGEFATAISDLGNRALHELGDAGPRCGLTLRLDNFPEMELPWYGFEPEVGGGQAFVIYCSSSDFQQPGPLTTTLSTKPEIWERPEGGSSVGADNSSQFSLPDAEKFLFHHLLFAGDILNNNMALALIPAGRHEAFQAAWSVVVDGRLAKSGLPGYSLVQRRGRFSRLFSGSGIMLPGHWDIFQALWDGGISDQDAVLGAIGRLPHL